MAAFSNGCRQGTQPGADLEVMPTRQVMRLIHDSARRGGICVEEHDAQGEAALHVPVASAPGDFVSFRLDSRNPQLARLPFLCPRRADASERKLATRSRFSQRSTD